MHRFDRAVQLGPAVQLLSGGSGGLARGKGDLLSLVLTGGQLGDSTLLPAAIDAIWVPRIGPGRTGTRYRARGLPSRANSDYRAHAGSRRHP